MQNYIGISLYYIKMQQNSRNLSLLTFYVGFTSVSDRFSAKLLGLLAQMLASGLNW